ILQSIRDPAKGTLGEIAQSLGRDLALAYGLDPVPGERQVLFEPSQKIELRDHQRNVELSSFRQIGAAKLPTRLEIHNRERRYQVTVDVSNVEVDVALDPELFAE